MAVDLASFRPNQSIPNRNRSTRILWSLLGLPLFRNSWLPGSGWRVALLRLFGAEVGPNVRIMTGVRVRYPWKLRIGKNSWIGENAWIDNWAAVTLGADVCVSQACYLCTGNHDWADPTFAMSAQPIVLEDGSWVASGCILAPGVRLGQDAIAAIGSVVYGSIPQGEIHGGNPATLRGFRNFREPVSRGLDREAALTSRGS